MKRRRPEPFAQTLARVTAQPPRAPSVPVGRHGDVWGDPDGVRYDLVSDQLSPADALALASGGARVVYDRCGCGGADCPLDWLSERDVRTLASDRTAPTVPPAKNGRADLEHWRSAAGQDLVVAAVEVSWGDRIGS